MMSEHFPRKPGGGYDFMASIDQFFQSAFRNFSTQLFGSSIPVRIKEEPDRFVIEAELTGIKKEQIELESLRQALIIRVRHKGEITTIDDETKLITKQHAISKSERAIPVPFPFTEEDIQAHYENGLLRIVIKGKRKTISIK